MGKLKPETFEQPQYFSELEKEKAQKNKYKGISIALLLFLIATFITLILVSLKKSNDIKIVVVDDSTGARYVPNAVKSYSSYSPDKAVIMTQLKLFTEKWRSVSIDSTQQSQMTDFVYNMIEGNAVSFMNNYYKENPPQERLEKERVDVIVYSMTPLSENTYQIFFRERVWNLRGDLLSENDYSLVFDTSLYAPRTQAQLEDNPIGLWIKDIHISPIRNGFIVQDNY